MTNTLSDTTSDAHVNSESYWDKRFISDWRERGGSEQTLFFYTTLLDYMPKWFFTAAKTYHWSICDWGCALGEGTNVLADVFPGEVTGIDFAAKAIDVAKQQFSKPTFIATDLLTTPHHGRYHVMLSSNTLEHFSDPVGVLNKIAAFATDVVVVMVPWREYARHEEHEATFDAASIPATIGNGEFVLAYSRTIPTSTFQPTYWWGDQVLSIYVTPRTMATLGLKLEDLLADQGETIAEESKATLAARELAAQIQSDLNGIIVAKDAELLAIQSQLSGVQAQIEQISASERDARQLAADFQSQLALSQAQHHVTAQSLSALQDKVASRENTMIWRLAGRFGGAQQGRFWGRLNFLRTSLRDYGAVWTATWLAKRLLGGKAAVGDQPLPVSQPVDPAHEITPIFAERIAIFSGLPMWDAGGGQRGAQLARQFARAGYCVEMISLFDARKPDGTPLERPKDDNSHGGLIRSRHLQDIGDAFWSEGPCLLALFEMPHPAFLPFLHAANQQGVTTIYDWIDPWDSDLGQGWFDVGVLERFVKDARKVSASALVLQAQAGTLGRNDALYVPNAGDADLFDASRSHERPHDMPKGRVALYVGSLYGSWLDWEQVTATAAADPSLQVALIGDPPADAPQSDNLHYLGPKPIADVAPYLHHAHSALIPFKVNALTAAVNPIKFHEYCLMGKPVISSDLPEVPAGAGVVKARNAAAFAAAALAPPVVSDDLARKAVMTQTWGARADQLLPREDDAGIAAIILIHNNADVIGLCLESLMLHGRGWLSQIIVVDNDSRDGGPALVAAMAKTSPIRLTLLPNAKNGCSSGRNLGLSAVADNARFVLFLDSDQWLSSSLGLRECQALMARDAELAAIGWCAATFEKRGPVLVSHMLEQAQAGFYTDEQARKRGYRTDFDYLATCGLLVRRDALKDVTFDTVYDPTCFEDSDICEALRAKGGVLGYRPWSGLHHKPHATTGQGDREAYSALYKRNSAIFSEKWGK